MNVSGLKEANVRRWADTIADRPAVQRGRKVNSIRGEPADQLRERHEASDFETKTQDKIGESDTAAGAGKR